MLIAIGDKKAKSFLPKNTLHIFGVNFFIVMQQPSGTMPTIPFTTDKFAI